MGIWYNTLVSMKYTYAYKTSDGTRHEAVMNAESREAVFATLRAKGIKAIKVVAADGSKANGEVRGGSGSAFWLQRSLARRFWRSSVRSPIFVPLERR